MIAVFKLEKLMKLKESSLKARTIFTRMSEKRLIEKNDHLKEKFFHKLHFDFFIENFRSIVLLNNFIIIHR